MEYHRKGARLSKDAYLEAQYRILRYEGIEPLWKAVQEYKAAPEMVESNETLIYTEARKPPLSNDRRRHTHRALDN